MAGTKVGGRRSGDLREQAERRAREDAATMPENLGSLSPEEHRRLLHELRVHQIELEMQNDELRRAQAGIEASRERYFDLYDLAPVGYLTVSESGLIVEGNVTAADLLGVARSALARQPLSRFILAEDQDIYYVHRKHLFEAGSPQTCEVRLLRRGGSPFWARLVASVAEEPSGVRVCRAVVSDIDELKAAERARAESEERYQSLTEASPVGIFRTDAQGATSYVNPKWCRLTGLSADEALGYGWLRAVHPDDRETLRTGWDAATRQQDASGGEYRLVRPDGSIAWVVGHATPQRDSAGRIVGYVGTITDISERKRAEEALARSRAQLEQSQKLEAVGRLAGGVAHDFNNILQAMLSLATVLRLKVGTPELARTVGEIDALVKRGAGLTQQLLLFSRRQMAARKPLDLAELTDSAAVLLRRLIPENIRLSVETEPEHLWVDGDAGQLQQVLVNLAVNARDAMPSGGTLTIRAEERGGEAVVEVIDTGHGMNEETRAHLFEPFFTTKEAGKGTGLGLSVVHGIVEQHGGRIEVESTPGAGSLFRVILPSAAAPEGKAAPLEGAAGAPRGHGERVLIVEDEEGAREGLAELLTILGYQVVAAGSGEEAGALPADPAPALLLTDLMLPGIDGAALAAGLRDRWPHLRVVLMSGYTEDEAVRRGVDEGAVRFLQKPFDMAALARAVSATLAEPTRRGEAGR